MIILYSSKEYNLTNGVPKSLLNIKENSELSFYITATGYQKVITIITVNNDVSPINQIVTCSYKNLNSNYFDTLKQILLFKQKGNYIGLHFTTNKNISYLSITINVGGNTYNLILAFRKISGTYCLHFHILLDFQLKNIKEK